MKPAFSPLVTCLLAGVLAGTLAGCAAVAPAHSQTDLASPRLPSAVARGASAAPGTSAASAASAAPAAALELAARRAQMIGWLDDYRRAGRFPTDMTGRPLSVFVDARGVRCPMAELIHQSGRDDLVLAVAHEANAVRLADVHEGPLLDWMLASGLTQEEIALVQGAANIDLSWTLELQPATQLAAGTAEVRGKLETALQVLRDGTARSLAIAVARLPANAVSAPAARDVVDALAHAPIRGPVVRRDAMPVIARARS